MEARMEDFSGGDCKGWLSGERKLCCVGQEGVVGL